MESVLSLLNAPGPNLKPVRPKALLDNCFRVMELLYCSCCKELSGDGAWRREVGHLGPGQLAGPASSWAYPLLPRATSHFWKPGWALGRVGDLHTWLGLVGRVVLNTAAVFFFFFSYPLQVNKVPS